MARKIYQWARYWKNVEDVNESLKTLEDLHEVNCLILLGEPGMGKTITLNSSYQTYLDFYKGNPCYRVKNFSLPDETEDKLKTIFQDPDFETWEKDDTILYLFLDSFDEAQIETRHVAKWLRSYLDQNKSNLPRLGLRLTCRDTDWSEDLEDKLKELWGANKVKIYQLQPLDHSAINLALEENKLDAVKFWQELETQNAFSFAQRPITLNFLIDQFSTTGQLPNSRKKLYEYGCKALCKELSKIHKDNDKLSPERRFQIAARLVAFSVFTNHSQLVNDFWTELTGLEDIEQETFIIHTPELEETLETALFTGGTVKQWTHKSYAEFLAAWYVAQKLTTSQLKDLIFHPYDGKIIPQLEEVSAWIASYKDETFDLIVKSNPEILLRSDLASLDISFKAKLTQGMLNEVEKSPHLRYRWLQLAVLNHPNLSNILRVCLEDNNKKSETHHLALEIAEQCNCYDLQDLLLQFALDKEKPFILRESAAQALLIVGDEAVKLQLRPLALLVNDSVENGTLKELGVKGAWPKNLIAGELFSTLLVNKYDYALNSFPAWHHLIIPELPVDDLPIALKWLGQNAGRSYDLESWYSDIFNEILYKAWNNLEQPHILEAFCETLVVLYQKHEPVFSKPNFRTGLSDKANQLTYEIVQQDRLRRQLVLHKLIDYAHLFVNNYPYYYFAKDIPLISFDDIFELAGIFSNCDGNKEKQEFVVAISQRLIVFDDPSQQPIFDTLNQLYPQFIEAINLPKMKQWAEERRLNFLKWEQEDIEARKKRNQSMTPPPLERAKLALEKFIAGDINSWWDMLNFLSCNEKGILQNHQLDITSLQNWSGLDENSKQKIKENSFVYLNKFDPSQFDWELEAPKRIFYPILAGCRTFLFVLQYTEEPLQKISFEAWNAWSCPVFYYLIYNSVFGNNKDKFLFHKLLCKICYIFSQEKILGLLSRMFIKDEFPIDNLKPILSKLWDDKIQKIILEELDNINLPNKAYQVLLSSLCEHSFDHAYPLLQKDLSLLKHNHDEKNLNRAIQSGYLLMKYNLEKEWFLIWNCIKQNNQFGIKFFNYIDAQNYDIQQILSPLSEEDLANLYIWYIQQFPNSRPEKRNHDLIRFIGSEEINQSKLLQTLISKGNINSYHQLQRIEETLNIALNQERYYVNQLIRQNTWRPIEIDTLKELIANSQKRWIQSEAQLLDVVIELLDKLNIKLQNAQLPSAFDLWNENKQKIKDGSKSKPKPIYRPKDEENLSDYVTRFLQENLADKKISVVREARIRRGQFTDISVETYTPQNHKLTVVIEVKGDWHEELKTAMQTQLKERYLEQNNLRYGLYLVGHFMCKEWDKNDSRYQKAPKQDDEALRHLLETQAKELSTDGFDIRFFMLDCRWPKK